MHPTQLIEVIESVESWQTLPRPAYPPAPPRPFGSIIHIRSTGQYVECVPNTSPSEWGWRTTRLPMNGD